MKLAYLDCFSGIAGDMFLAALLDAALIDLQLLNERLSVLGLGVVRTRANKARCNNLTATHLQFEVTHDAHIDRRWVDIRTLIQQSKLTAPEKSRAIVIFQSLAEAEAKIHSVPVDQVHFHELGTVDSILDIVGAAIAIESLKIEHWYTSQINVGSGTVETAHGQLPVPAPATLELLKGFPIYSAGIEAELVTPTGAAILKHLAPELGLPQAQWQFIGYGAGTRRFSTYPSALRLLVGNSFLPFETGETVVIETEIDDMNAEFFPHVQQKLLEKGAKSISAQSILMKKGRPGLLLRTICNATQVDALCEILFRETTTLGAVYYPVQRKKLAYKTIEIETPYGKVRVKLGVLGTEIINIAPEYEDCKKIADEKGVALKEIYRVTTEEAGHSTV